jgi:uncharacterized SAM-binding protein YcdF (DUF218 family)
LPPENPQNTDFSRNNHKNSPKLRYTIHCTTYGLSINAYLHMKGIILVLGAPNSDEGKLSEIAGNRLDATLRFYAHNPEFKIVCTGGSGPHFNNTQTPHAAYAREYLVGKGIPDTAILEYVLSKNTLEDALLAKPLVEKYGPRNIVIITSDFHMKRAGIIFRHVLDKQNLIFVEARSTLDLVSLEKLAAHELEAIGQFMLRIGQKPAQEGK